MPQSFSSLPDALRRVPATLALIALSLAGFLLLYLLSAPLDIVAQFTFADIRLLPGQRPALPILAESWRWVTPIFLHSGWLHIGFNALWLWELGTLIEQKLGALALLAVVLLSAAASNGAQFWYGGSALFGGMSGVVYALLGFCALGQRLAPHSGLFIMPAILWFMLGWLLFCMLGPTELLGFGRIANAAHLGGLLCGCALALVWAALRHRSRV